ncbi:hypothetical protein F2Q69_00018758 [Brassica cretica]|uniref:Uncharacterized protein n=1 Tax=Brassica cretica TaxID=69181 RepID=A0A8S9QUB9_BRACR|nr:hypothetical protein F2Q69_00018758 [Brassica cretica]
MFMDSSSSSSSLSITREELNAFHSFDRALFTRIVISLKEDITQSFQVMTFLIYLDRSVRGSKLISDLVSLPDLSISTIVDEVQICRRCLSYTHFPTFLASMGSINAASIPWIRRMTSEKLTLAVIHLNRNEIILEMTDILNTICYPAFEDICVLFKTHKERKFIQFLCGQQGTSNRVAAGTSNVEGQHVRADDRTVFLKFSKGYPISEAEVHDYFTRIFGDIVEAIHMGGVKRKDQAMYACMVLRSAAKIPEIVSDGLDRTKFTINGKYFWARRFIPNHKIR